LSVLGETLPTETVALALAVGICARSNVGIAQRQNGRLPFLIFFQGRDNFAR
jgi:hypothetical protein